MALETRRGWRWNVFTRVREGRNKYTFFLKSECRQRCIPDKEVPSLSCDS